jgi:hypothetical protein
LKDGFVDITDFKIKYNQTTGLNGRLQANASIGLQGMVREIRHLIAFDNYVDIDISNAHPVFTEWLCDNLDVECHELREYINNREKIIEEIINYSILNGGKKIDRSFVKTYILKISYGCGDDAVNVIKPKHRHPFIDAFVKCIRRVGSRICDLMPEFHSNNVERRAKAGKNYNLTGSTMSHLNQYVENQVLMKMYSFLLDNEFKLKSALCFDGIMVHKKCFTVDFNKDNFFFVIDCISVFFYAFSTPKNIYSEIATTKIDKFFYTASFSCCYYVVISKSLFQYLPLHFYIILGMTPISYCIYIS